MLTVPLLKLCMQGVSDRKTAKQYMDAMMIYPLGNLAAFFESVNKSREEK